MNSPLMLEIGNRHQKNTCANRSSLACTAEYFCHPKSRPEKSFRRKQQNLRLFSDTGGNVRHFCYEYRTTYHRHSRRYDALMLILNTRSCISYKYAAPFTFIPLSMCYPKTQSSYLLPSILLPQLPALFLQKALLFTCSIIGISTLYFCDNARPAFAEYTPSTTMFTSSIACCILLPCPMR